MQNINHAFFTGIGSNTKTTSLPVQTVSDKEKDKDKFKHGCMDALESIGLSQKAHNIEFREFYKMTQGDLVYSDFDADASILNDIKKLGDEVEIPTFVKHYDFIGVFTNQLVGEWLNQKDDFKVDCIDSISKNDFIRERTERVKEFASKTFAAELEQRLVEKGLDPNREQFASEEERQQYLQQLQQQKDEIMQPKDIEADMKKNWKTKAAEWAEHVIEADQERFYLDQVDAQEMKDYILTGRFFRHYYVGYDYYEPENWKIEETFFSEDIDARYPQDGEYVGRITEVSATKLIERYGHLLSPTEIKSLQKSYQGGDTAGNDQGVSWKSMMNGNFFGQHQVIPFQNYYDHDLGLQVQDALDIPMGETTIQQEDGQQVQVPTWLPQWHAHNHQGNRYASVMRDDIKVRHDLLQVTEAYWKSWKRMWFLNYTTEDGIPQTEIVTDDLLEDFIKENNIKKVRTKSIEQIKNDLEENTMYEFWIPEVWKGIKVNAGNTYLTEPIYLGVEPLPYQIRGKSNIFDVQLPVAGIITSSIAKKLRPYQIGYNICWNQIINLLEKEIGTFFLFDINFLPSEYKNNGTSEDALERIADLAKRTGLVPLDTKKDNMEGANPQMNTFMAQDISFDKQIQSRYQLANIYYTEALKQIGITQQRLGNPGKYETAQGVEQGVTASYTQTLPLFTDMSVARRKAMELHLAVAQYCQKEYIDADFVFTKSDGDKHFMSLTDPDFPLRRMGILPTNDPKKRRELETIKRALLENNTIDRDTLEYVEIATSDTAIEMISIARRNRLEREARENAQREHEQQLVDKQIEAKRMEIQEGRAFEAEENRKDRENRVLIETIEAKGRAADQDAKQSDMDSIERSTNMALKQQEVSNKIETNNRKADVTEQTAKTKTELEKKEMALREQELEQKNRKINNDRYIAEINKN